MKKLSIVIPVYNEEKTLKEILDRVSRVPLQNIEKEIIIVDDFSTDRTRSLLKEISKKHKVVLMDKNRGKGSAVRAGIQNATGDIIIIQDADLEYNPNEYPAIIKPIIDGETQVVYGSRFLNSPGRRWFLNKHERSYILATLGSRAVTILTNILFRTGITDEATCYKCFKSDIIKNIKIESDRFNWEPEVTAKIAKMGIKIYEVPISYKPRTFEEGKKINWKDGMQAIWTLIKYRFKK